MDTPLNAQGPQQAKHPGTAGNKGGSHPSALYKAAVDSNAVHSHRTLHAAKCSWCYLKQHRSFKACVSKLDTMAATAVLSGIVTPGRQAGKVYTPASAVGTAA